MSDPITLGPGPSAPYQPGAMDFSPTRTIFESDRIESKRNRRGVEIHQRGLTSASTAQISQDPFNMLPEYGLVRIIMQLSGAPSVAGTRLKESRFLSLTRREPVFHRIIVNALPDNPRAIPAIRDAILKDNPELLPTDKRIILQECRELASLVRPEIQAAKDKNLIKFFDRVMTQINTWNQPNFTALPLDTRIQAQEIRKWMDVNQVLLNQIQQLGVENADLEFIPRELSKFVNLGYLTLEGNKLSNIPDSFANLTRLSTLNLSKNQFSRFPQVILQLENLTNLYFSVNGLESIPQTLAIKLKKLEHLCFHRNKLKQLPQNIYALETLIFLNISRNPDFNQSFPYSEIRRSEWAKALFVQYKFSTPRAVPLNIEIGNTPLEKQAVQDLQSSQSSSSSSGSTKRKREAEPLG